jgi:L-serine dehydratase
MNVSVFDLFKIGIGPSSSHTMGPMTATGRFLDVLHRTGCFNVTARVQVTLYASLALTGRGHATDRATILGLAGLAPVDLDPRAADDVIVRAAGDQQLLLGGERDIRFDAQSDIVWEGRTRLPQHPNAMKFASFNAAGSVLVDETYFHSRS